MTRLAAVSVDLDAMRFYRAIHGVTDTPTPSESAEDAWLSTAVLRLAEWAAAVDIPLTWFVVGSDLTNQRFCDALAGLARRGHELGNHTFEHCYDLTRRGRDFMHAQVLRGAEALGALTGKAQQGFRAPGYTMTDELHSVLLELDVSYDSSVFPCPAYYAAKAVALLGQRAFRRESHAILDEPRVLAAPRRPYRMGESYHRRGSGILELPIQVTPTLRLPYIGTSLSALGPFGAQVLTAQLVGEPLVNLELHAIDALDASDDLSALAKVQPDLRIRWQRKLSTFAGVVRQLKLADYSFVRLGQAAAAFA